MVMKATTCGNNSVVPFQYVLNFISYINDSKIGDLIVVLELFNCFYLFICLFLIVLGDSSNNTEVKQRKYRSCLQTSGLSIFKYIFWLGESTS